MNFLENNYLNCMISNVDCLNKKFNPLIKIKDRSHSTAKEIYIYLIDSDSDELLVFFNRKWLGDYRDSDREKRGLQNGCEFFEEKLKEIINESINLENKKQERIHEDALIKKRLEEENHMGKLQKFERLLKELK